MQVGVPEALVVDMFLALWGRNSQKLRIAHNESFDARILRIAIKRHIDPRTPGVKIAVSDLWKSGAAECTQIMATPIVKAPPTEKMKAMGRNHFKSANLGEAYEHFTGKKLENAHSAMTDVQGCMAVYFAIKDLAREKAA